MAETLSDRQHEAAADLDPPAADCGVSPALEFAGPLSWKQRLAVLQQQARAALERLSAFLHRRQSSPAEASVSDEMGKHLAETLETISMRQDSLESILTSASAELPAAGRLMSETGDHQAAQWREMMADRLASIESVLQSMSDRLEPRASIELDEDNSELADTVLQSDQPAQTPLAPSDAPDEPWMAALLGASLSDDPRLGSAIDWLHAEVLSGNPSALSLLGQVVVFRCAAADRKPTLLKDLGEAYYRSYPKQGEASHPFENALAEWVGRYCEEAGLPNSIELVHAGDRYDATRHASIQRGGVEVTEVLGWIVLREGGKVFAKASVQTR